MPKYDYKCDKCEEVIEIVKSMSDDHPTDCECGGHLSLVWNSAPGITFKGSGFYKTGG